MGPGHGGQGTGGGPGGVSATAAAAPAGSTVGGQFASAQVGQSAGVDRAGGGEGASGRAGGVVGRRRVGVLAHPVVEVQRVEPDAGRGRRGDCGWLY